VGEGSLSTQSTLTEPCPWGSVLISDVAPGFSPACAALKGDATFKLGHYHPWEVDERIDIDERSPAFPVTPPYVRVLIRRSGG
jgi:hypothetical protein